MSPYTIDNAKMDRSFVIRPITARDCYSEIPISSEMLLGLGRCYTHEDIAQLRKQAEQDLP
jgi:hypothetical protein